MNRIIGTLIDENSFFSLMLRIFFVTLLRHSRLSGQEVEEAEEKRKMRKMIVKNFMKIQTQIIHHFYLIFPQFFIIFIPLPPLILHQHGAFGVY